MLPGDAPDQDSNKINYFTVESAKKLFDDLIFLWNKLGSKHKILIHNGPRTGKYDQQTGKEKCKHESENDVDQISNYLINLFKDIDAEFSFINFYKSNNVAHSSFNPLLYIAQLSGANNYFIVPGESVSMLSQIPLYLDPLKAIAFRSSSMNQEHLSFFKQTIEDGHMSYFQTEHREIITPKSPRKTTIEDLTKDLNNIVNDITESYHYHTLGECINSNDREVN